jgi:Ca2+-binding RTX toxin-like protein
MRRLLLLTSLLLGLAAPASAGAATTIVQPLDPSNPVVATGTPGADTLRASAENGEVRIEDATGVTLGAGAFCTSDGPTAVVCDPWMMSEFRLGAGADTLRLEPDWDGNTPTIHAEGGNDLVDSGAAWFDLDGGAGTDRVSFARYDGWNLTVQLGHGDITGVEVLEGSPQNDSLFGTSAAETIHGGAGEDYIDPGSGADVIDAGADDDNVYAIDGTADTIACGGGFDHLGVDAGDVRAADCEMASGPGVTPPPPTGVVYGPVFAPPPYPVGATSRPPTRITRPGRGRRGVISVLSRPAADAGRTRIGARVGAPTSGAKIRMTVRHGDRRIGQSEVVAQNPGEVVINVPLDAQLRQEVARTRHVVLTALIELEHQGAGIGEEYQATVVEPPPYVRGAAGVRRRGGFGEQRLSGTGRGDTLHGESGDDRLQGRGGNDDLDGGTGNDRLAGSAGNDRLDGYDGDDTLMGGAGDDLIIESRFGDDTLHGGAGDDWIVGARGTDHITGGAGDDVIFGGSGSDTFDCGPGDDTVFVNLETERKTARGCETILDEDDIPSIRCPAEGTADGETMLGSDHADVCKGNAGDDDVEGAGGSDKLFGGEGADRVFGRFGNDQMFGDAGDDELEGGRGDDRLSGGSGDDQLNGGYGRDRLDGGPGNDTLISRGGGSDQLDCGPGRDVAIADRTDRLTGCEKVRRG